MKTDGRVVLSTKIDTSGLKNSKNKIKSAISGFSKYLKGFAVSVGAAFSVSAIVNFSKQTAEVATQAESNMQRIVDIFGSANKEVSDFIDSNARLLGMSKSSAASFAAVYGNLFSVWAGQEQNAKLTASYLNMTAVVASKTGRTVEDVQERVRSGLLGNTEAIEDLGVFVNVKVIEMTDAFKRMANGRSWEQLSAYEQQQIRTLAILEQATEKYGTEVADTSAIIKARHKAAYEDFQATWGQVVNIVLIPVWKVVTEIFNVATKGLQTLFGLSSSTADSASKYSENINGATKNQSQLNEELEGTNKELKKATAGFDEILTLSSNETAGTSTATELDLSKYGVGTVGAASDAAEKVDAVLNPVIGKIKELIAPLAKIDFSATADSLGRFGDSVKGLAEIGVKGLEWVWFDILVPISEYTIEDNIPAFLDSVTSGVDLLRVACKKLGEVAEPIVDKFFKPIAEKIGSKTVDVFKDVSKKHKEATSALEKSEAWQDLKVVLEAVATVLAPIAEMLVDFIFWSGNFQLNDSWVDLKILFYDIGDVIGLIADLINGDFSGAWGHLEELLVSNRIDHAKQKFNLLKQSVSDASNIAKDFAVKFQEALSGIVSNWSNKISSWWDGNVEPWFTVEKWESVIQGMVDGFANSWNKVYDFFDVEIPIWWNNNISPWFTKEKWAELFWDVVSGIKDGWKSVTNFFTKSVPEWWDNKVSPWFTKKKWRDLGKNVASGLINPMIEGLNKFITELNKFSIDIPKIKGITDGFTFGFNIPTIPRLAKGAVIPPNREFMAVLGDQKHGTNIEAPLETIKQALAEVLAVQSGTSEIVVSVNFTGDLSQLARVLKPAIDTETRRKGGSLATGGIY